MHHLTIDIGAILAQYDFTGFFIVTSGIIGFWVLMAWLLLFIIDRMR